MHARGAFDVKVEPEDTLADHPPLVVPVLERVVGADNVGSLGGHVGRRRPAPSPDSLPASGPRASFRR